jgi:hypothetical protein
MPVVGRLLPEGSSGEPCAPEITHLSGAQGT